MICPAVRETNLSIKMYSLSSIIKCSMQHNYSVDNKFLYLYKFT